MSNHLLLPVLASCMPPDLPPYLLTRMWPHHHETHHAADSSSTQYSRPNGSGVQHMFLCRVVVGEYCMGVRDALTPDVRSGHKLYDTTVNNMSDPAIYVTYHDAQAYPDYLVRFRQ